LADVIANPMLKSADAVTQAAGPTPDRAAILS
jgi:hypothetical protein